MSSDLTPVSELSVYCSRAKIALPVFTFIDRPGSGFVDFQCFCVFFGKRFESKWFRNKQSAKQDVSKLILEDLPNLSVKTDRHTVSTTAISLMTDFYNNHRLKLPYLVVNQVCGLDGVRYNAVGHTVDGMVKYNCDFMTENDARNDMAGQLLKSAEHFVASRMKPSPLVTIYDVKRDYVAMIHEYCKRNDFLKFKVQYFETGSSGLRKFACEIKFSKLWVRSPYSFDNRTEAEQYCAFVCCHILKHLYGKVEAYAYFRSQPGELPPQVYSKPSEIIINVLPLVPLDMSYSPFLVPRKEEENQVYVPVEKKSEDVKYTRCKFDMNDDWMWADMRSADVERTDLEKIVDVHSEEVQKLVVIPPEENTKVMAAMTVPVADEYREDVRFDNIEPIVYFDAPGRSIVPVRHYYRKRIPTSGDMMCGFDRRFWIRVLSFVDVKSLFRNCIRVCRYIYDVIKLREFWQYKKSNLKEGMFLQVRKFIEKFPVEAWCGIYLDYPMMANRDVICDFTIKQLKNLLARAGPVWSLTISRVVGFSSLDTRVKRMGIYSSVSHGIKCNVLYNDTGTPRWNNDLDRGADTGGKYLATRTLYPGRIMQLMIDLPNEPVMRRLIHKLFCCEGGGLEVFYSDEPYGYYYTVVAMYYSPLTANLIEIGCETYPPTLKGNFQYFGV